jgi:hypothetical protein
LNLLSLLDEKRILARPSLRNLAVGIGEWISADKAVLKGWPFFSQFDGGKVPSFVFQLQRGIQVSPSEFLSDSSFYLSGGTSGQSECSIAAGTPSNREALRLPISFSVEIRPKKSGTEFLFVVRALSVTS